MQANEVANTCLKQCSGLVNAMMGVNREPPEIPNKPDVKPTADPKPASTTRRVSPVREDWRGESRSRYARRGMTGASSNMKEPKARRSRGALTRAETAAPSGVKAAAPADSRAAVSTSIAASGAVESEAAPVTAMQVTATSELAAAARCESEAKRTKAGMAKMAPPTPHMAPRVPEATPTAATVEVGCDCGGGRGGGGVGGRCLRALLG